MHYNDFPHISTKFPQIDYCRFDLTGHFLTEAHSFDYRGYLEWEFTEILTLRNMNGNFVYIGVMFYTNASISESRYILHPYSPWGNRKKEKPEVIEYINVPLLDIYLYSYQKSKGDFAYASASFTIRREDQADNYHDGWDIVSFTENVGIDDDGNYCDKYSLNGEEPECQYELVVLTEEQALQYKAESYEYIDDFNIREFMNK